MIKVNKVNISVIDKIDELGNSKLDFKISGSSIDYVVVNTIRRTIFSDMDGDHHLDGLVGVIG